MSSVAFFVYVILDGSLVSLEFVYVVAEAQVQKSRMCVLTIGSVATLIFGQVLSLW